MPPKSSPMAQDQFLAACFKYCVEKPRVDFNKLGPAIGMSPGGANNKFRAIMKVFEEEAVNSGNSAPATPKSAATTTTKRKAPSRTPAKTTTTSNGSNIDIDTKATKVENNVDEDEDEGKDDGISDEVPPPKKVNATPNKAATPTTNNGRKKGKATTKKVVVQSDDKGESKVDEEMSDKGEKGPLVDGETGGDGDGKKEDDAINVEDNIEVVED